MKQITMALHEYHEAHGRFPPAVVRDAVGRPLYSWRVLILPYLEANVLANEFKRDEAWDGPHNQALLTRMPSVFAPPEIDDLTVEPFTTFYQVVTGPGTAFDGEDGLRMPEDFPDGTASTLLIVEAAEAVPWTKPSDLAYAPDTALPAVGGVFKSKGRFSFFGDSRVKGFNVAFVDGSVRFFDGDANETPLRSLITRNGGEQIERE